MITVVRIFMPFQYEHSFSFQSKAIFHLKATCITFKPFIFQVAFVYNIEAICTNKIYNHANQWRN